MTEYNIQALVRDLAFAVLIATAMSMLLLLGELDLSVGANASLSGVLAGTLMVQHGVPAFLAFVIGALLGGVFGAINGILVAGLRLNSLVVTIGMTGVYSGIALVLTKGKAITGIPEEILFLGKGTFFGIPIPFIVAAVVLLLALAVLRWTPIGRYVYAIGNSAEASRLIGIRVDRIRVLLFASVGTVAGLAGMLYVARLGSSQTSIGGEWAINGIAAAVIGGIALTGGTGSPLGGAIGAAIISVISNLIVLFGVNVYWQSAVSGIVVVLAISLGSFSAMRRARRERMIKTRDAAAEPLKVGV
ncbi:ABC transporter permease [Mycetocola miduiensis]|uniref:ABC transporter permease n=1 Tax=Mycetocola miduiensis TaxID=995034 RepID=UPI001C431DE5|nr:ABC transporter permease [Mycetocola miduiensis]